MAGCSLFEMLEKIKLDKDIWQDADMQAVCDYLRGSKKLSVPQEIRNVLGMNRDV